MSDSLLNGALRANRPASPTPQLFSAPTAPDAAGTAADASFSRALERRMENAEKPSSRGAAESSPAERAQRTPPAPERPREATRANRPERPAGDAGERGAQATPPSDDSSQAVAEVTDEEATTEQAAPADPAASLAAFLPQLAATAGVAGEAPAEGTAVDDPLTGAGGRGKSALAALATLSPEATVAEEPLAADGATTDPAGKSGAAALQKLLGEAAERQAAARPEPAQSTPGDGAAAKAWKPETLQTSLAALAAARPATGAADAAGALPRQAESAPQQAEPVAPAPPFAPELRAEAARPTTQMPVATPVGQRAWAEDVGSKVMWLAGRGETKAELVLTPPSLGKLEVSINLAGDQSTAHFVAASTAARDALEQAMPRLRELLQQAGINLGEANVSTSGEHAAGQEARRGGNTGGRAGDGEGAGTGVVTTATTAGAWTRLGNGLVDTFA